MPRAKEPARPDWAYCAPRQLPSSMAATAAATATRINPVNAPSPAGVSAVVASAAMLLSGGTPPPAALANGADGTLAVPPGLGALADTILTPGFIAVLTSKYWGTAGVSLTVGFMEQTAANLRDRILSHMNSWGEWANVRFVWSTQNPKVRITRAKSGYWSYLGTDVLLIPADQATMCLQGFTMNTPESEYRRVVRHETGHTLGFPHEHMRRELVNRLDPAKTIAWGQSALGWDRQTVIQQILTPLEDSSLLGTERADQESIMCYQLPASITKDGKPVTGGYDIDGDDAAFAARIYPKPGQPKPPDPPPGC